MEFHAFVVCGPGKRLSPFSKERSTGVPKALLPLAQKPMFEHVLDWCEKAFFARVTMLCDEESSESINAAVEKYKAKKRAAADSAGAAADSANDPLAYIGSIDVMEYSGSSNGEVLQFLSENNLVKPQEHFVLLPCDFVTNLPPQVLIEAYRCRQDTDMGVLVYYKNQMDIEDKKNTIFPRNFSVYTDVPSGQLQLLDYYSTEDVEFHKSFKLRTRLLWSHPKATVSSKLLNSSIFFGDSKLIYDAFTMYAHKFTESYFASRPLVKIIRDLARMSWQSSRNKSTVGFFVIPHQATFFRSNSLPVYMEANRHFLKLQARDGGAKPAAPKDKVAANVGVDSMVGENTVLGERTNVKRSVVGANCVIGKRAKITGCIIFDNVVLEDDVQLENTIVGHGVVVESKSKLTNCYVESTHRVTKGTQSKGDTLVSLTLEGLVESAVESSSSDDGDTDESYDDYEDEYGDNSDGLFAY